MDLDLEGLAQVAAVAGATAFAALALIAGVVTMSRPRARSGRLLVGTMAAVTVPIPRGGVGVVVSSAAGGRAVRPARDVDGGSIGVGARVVVVEVTRGVAAVRALPHDLLEVFR